MERERDYVMGNLYAVIRAEEERAQRVSKLVRMKKLLEAWFASTVHGGEHNASWPARQSAFSHDPTVYNEFKEGISIMPSACPLGSPYGIALGHVLGGSIVGAFDPEQGRDVYGHGGPSFPVHNYSQSSSALGGLGTDFP